MRENFGPTKYPREKILDPRNTQEKKFETHEIPMRKYFRPTKYPREKFRTHEGTMADSRFISSSYPKQSPNDQWYLRHLS